MPPDAPDGPVRRGRKTGLPASRPASIRRPAAL